MDIITTPAVTAAPGADSIIQTAAVYMDSRGVPPIVHLTQYDQTMPVVAVKAYYRNQPYKFPEGAAVNIRMSKPDGKHVYNPALGLSEDRLTAYIAVTGQMTAAAGEGRAVVEVARADSIAATAPIVFHIHRNPVPEDAYESVDEYKTLLELVEDAAKSAEAAETARSASEEAAKEAADKLGEVQQAGEEALGNIEEQRQSTVDEMEQLRDAAEGYKDAAAGSAADAKKDADRADDAAARAQSIAQGSKGYYATAEELTTGLPTAENGDWAIVGKTDTIWVWDGDSGGWVDTRQVTDAELTEKLAGKQDVLTFDDAPAAASPNPVTSGGVYDALAGKADKADTDPVVAWHSNPNLLDNWYFVNPINQKGQTEYDGASDIICLDRWHITQSGKVSITDTDIKITSGEKGFYFHQFMENYAKYNGRTLTMSVLYRSTGGVFHIELNGGGENHVNRYDKTDIPDTDGQVGLVSLTGRMREPPTELRTVISSAAVIIPEIHLIAVKLELGDRQTLAHQEGEEWVLNDPPPNPATELLKCQRYYQVFATEALRPTEAEDFRPPMRIKPTKGTITVGEKTLYTADANL